MDKIYLMGNVPYILKSKFGITRHDKARVKSVSKTTSGKAYYLIAPVSMPFAYECEQFVHRLYGFINAPFKSGSGKTEWFLNINPIVFSAVWYFFGQDLSTAQLALIAFSPFVWIDAILWLIVFSILKIAIALIFVVIAATAIYQWIFLA